MAISDAIFNISMMPEWHQLDSSSAMPEQQESTKKKTLKSSSRSYWFLPDYHDHIIIRFLINLQVQGHHPHQWAPFQVTG